VLVDAARAIDAVLDRLGLRVPAYVFGHSHRPAVMRLAPGSDATYANAGAWTRLRPPEVADLLGRNRYPFLRVAAPDAPPDAVAVSLGVWDGDEGREADYPDGTSAGA